MNDQMTALAARAEARCRSRFDEIDRVALLGTEKVLAAFAEAVSYTHLTLPTKA